MSAAIDRMQDAPITPASRIRFHELVVHREPGRAPLLGCKRVRRFLEVDDETLAAVDAIQASPSLAEAEQGLQARTGQAFDLADLVNLLYKRGFVRTIDDRELEAEPDARERHRVLHSLDPRYLRFLHAPVFVGTVAALIAFWVLLVIRDPSLLPQSGDYFLFDRPALVTLSVLGGFLGLAYIHELAHFFMARSYGVDATIRFSHRFYVLVLQTDVTNAWILPARQRVAIFLAGPAFNLLFSAIVGLLLYATDVDLLTDGTFSPPVLRFLLALNMAPLLFQLFIFARTDLYHVILAATGSRNLVAAAMAYVRFHVVRLVKLARRAERRTCDACHAKALLDDPFCWRCAAALPVDDPNKYPFQGKDRWSLLGFGFLFYAAAVAGYAFFFLFVGPALVRQLERGVAFLLGAAAIPSFWRLLEAEWVLILSALPIIFILYSMGKSTLLVIEYARFKIRRSRAARSRATGSGTTARTPASSVDALPPAGAAQTDLSARGLPAPGPTAMDASNAKQS